jgi:hypothetical protein
MIAQSGTMLAYIPLLMFPVVVLVSAMLFTVWLVVSIFQLAARLVVLLARGAGELLFGPSPITQLVANAAPKLPSVTFRTQNPFDNAVGGAGRLCPRSGCRNLNVAEANFCARCGMRLVATRGDRSDYRVASA